MKTFSFGKSLVSEKGPCYVIAEIGHNHQGSLETALKMIKIAAACGVQAVKFQKRDNKSLYTRAFYNKPYDNENSYGSTYGEHREFLEFGRDEYVALMKCAEENNVEFMSTAFDFKSADFLEELGVTSYKIASADLINTPLIEYVAKFNKPVFLSTGACTHDEVRLAYDTVLKHNDKLCLLHCMAGYPTEYHDINLNIIQKFKADFPEAIIGYSGHDNGILAAIIAYMMGATVLEKHFTLNRAWKGTDHKFSLEPEGLRKQVRDLRRVDMALGSDIRKVYDIEVEPRKKMGKGIYASRSLSAGTVLTIDDLALRTPPNGLPPYRMNELIGKKLKVDVAEEGTFSLDMVEQG